MSVREYNTPNSKMVEAVARRVLRGNVGDFREIEKTVLCLQRIAEADVGVVTTFLSYPPIR